MKTILLTIDNISEQTAKFASWLCIVLVVIICYEVAMRHIFDNPTIWVYETSMMVAAAIASLAWSVVHKRNGHIRVEAIYDLLSTRKKALIDTLFGWLFFLPLIGGLTYAAAQITWASWSSGEIWAEAFWYPPKWPAKAVVFLGLLMFTLQGLAQTIRDSYFLWRDKPYD